METVGTILDSTDVEHFHPPRKFCWAHCCTGEQVQVQEARKTSCGGFWRLSLLCPAQASDLCLPDSPFLGDTETNSYDRNNSGEWWGQRSIKLVCASWEGGENGLQE